jgi:putative ABC transport system ATP-binding protein
MTKVLELNDVSYSYKGTKKKVLNGVSHDFETKKVYAITGRSGSGKTTLLSILSGLTSPTGGSVVYDGQDMKKIDRYSYRSRDIGVIFQSFNLLPHLTALENIILSMDASGKQFDRPKKVIAQELLEKVELDPSYANTKILHLSGGEQQRIAIARSLSYNPDVILADEPTGNLDLGTQDEIMNIFKSLAHDDGKCVIIVTHSPDVAKQSDEVFELASLKGKADKPAKPAKPAKKRAAK